MGLLTILKKLKRKEREVRVLILYVRGCIVEELEHHVTFDIRFVSSHVVCVFSSSSSGVGDWIMRERRRFRKRLMEKILMKLHQLLDSILKRYLIKDLN